MLKHLPRKKLILAGGDILLLIISFYACYAIRHGQFVNVISKHTGATILFLCMFIFVFYMADIYNTEGKFYSTNNILKIIVSIIIANGFIAGAFYLFSFWYFSRGAFAINILLVFLFCESYNNESYSFFISSSNFSFLYDSIFFLACSNNFFFIIITQTPFH